MSDKELKTLENIHNAAKAEFLEKGFLGASLRNIVKTAGVTTGAFYGYYESKEELFEALVSRVADFIMLGISNAQAGFNQVSDDQKQSRMGEFSWKNMEQELEYVFAYKDEFKLLLLSSAGTKYENFIHQLVEIEKQSTKDYMGTMKKLGHDVPEFEDDLEHMIISGMFTAFFELILHDIPKETAFSYAKILVEFHVAGWKKIMGL